MKVNILSLNVRGLNDDAAIALLYNYIQHCRPALNIVLIQEHKTLGPGLSLLGPRLWRHATARGLAASISYDHQPRDSGAGCGGVLSLLAPWWTRQNGTHGSLMENRVHRFTLTGLPGGDVGIANIYATNDSPSRCTLWETLARDLPSTTR